MKMRIILGVWLAALIPGVAAGAQAPASAAVQGRRAALLRDAVRTPFPKPACDGGNKACVNGQITLALALLASGDRAGVDQANLALGEALAAIRQVAAGPAADDVGEDAGDPVDSFYFVKAALLYRMARLYGPSALGGNGRLSPQVADGIVAAFRSWSGRSCPAAISAPAQMWSLWKSENHDAQRSGACWAAADLLRRDPRSARLPSPDGTRPADQAARWTRYLVAYLTERAHRGTVELYSYTYSPYFLSPIYNYADFSDDPSLRRAATSFLDLWWTHWAEEQVGGCYGGAQNRDYPEFVGRCMMSPVVWMYFGVGDKGHDTPGYAAEIASGYAPPSAARALVADPARRGSYETFAHSPGLLSGAGPKGTVSPSPAILRITYVTPGFVAGMPVVTRAPATAWNLGAVQNLRASVVMAGADQNIVFQPMSAGRGRSGYNGLWGLQSRGTQVLALAPPPYSKNTDMLRVFIGKGLRTTRSDGWLFAEGTAFTAIRPLAGGLRPDPDGGWLDFDQPRAPVVVQTSPRSAYPSLEAFRRAVMAMPISGGGARVTVQGLDGARRIDFSADGTSAGLIGGRPVDPRAGGPTAGPVVKSAGPDAPIYIGASIAFPAAR